MTNDELGAIISAAFEKSIAQWAELFEAQSMRINDLMDQMRALIRKVEGRSRNWHPLPERPACAVIDIRTRKAVAL